MAFLREAGFRLGLNPDAVEAIFVEMKKHKTGMIPTERLVKIFKTYHNYSTLGIIAFLFFG